MGRFTGAQVVEKHRRALSRCAGKAGWELLACIVDAMQQEYGKTPIGGYGYTPPPTRPPVGAA